MKPEENVYFAYFKSKKEELYFNEIKKLSELSDSSLSRTLEKLVKENRLLKNKTKSNTFYKINNRKLFALKFSETALRKFEDLDRAVRIPILEFLSNLNNSVFSIILFGSASIKQETEKSDIDLLIVTYKELINLDKAKRKAELISNYPFNIFTCDVNEFRTTRDHLIKQAKRTGFPIKGEQNFYEVILDEH